MGPAAKSRLRRASGAGALVLAALASGGCPSRPGAPAQAPGAARPVPSTPLAQAVPLKLEGPYVHAGTGIEFPATAEGFRRVLPRRYDEEGNDVGIGYSRVWKDFHAEVTIYAYPAPLRADGQVMTFDEQFTQECLELRQGKEGVKLIATGPVPGTLGGAEVAGRFAEFECAGTREFGGRRVATVLTSFPKGDWRLKYRVTLPAERRDPGLAAVRDLLATLKLPPLGVTLADVAPAEAPK
jgi:hypothetical protein